jgi:hypothetical protein
MTRGTGRQSAVRIAAAEDLLSGGDQLPIFRRRGLGSLLSEKDPSACMSSGVSFATIACITALARIPLWKCINCRVIYRRAGRKTGIRRLTLLPSAP